MYVARILYPVEVLGPGRRVGIWFCGCPRRCKGCSNPELWETQERYRTTPEQLLQLIRRVADRYPIDGFTLTGGDPMYQAEAVRTLIPLIRDISKDILVYTGYLREELPPELLQGVSVLIDGEYIESRNIGCFLRGSDNQRIHLLDERFRARYEEYLRGDVNRIQNFTLPDGVVSVGIHRPDFLRELDRSIIQKGLSGHE